MKDPKLWDANRHIRSRTDLPDRPSYSWIDVESEAIIYRDQHGITRFDLAELPGKLLTFFMLAGMRHFMTRENDPRTVWLAWKNGVMPRHRTKALPPDAPIRKLSIWRQAIVNALQQLDGCEATVEQTEKLVRAMTAGQVKLWQKEPDVIMQLRLLRGEKPLQLENLLSQIK